MNKKSDSQQSDDNLSDEFSGKLDQKSFFITFSKLHHRTGKTVQLKHLNLTDFKRILCPHQNEPHNHKCCYYYHTIKDKRRDDNLYTPELCKFAETEKCPKKQKCKRAHNRVERLYHKDKYKTKFCHFYPNKIKTCDYSDYCSFAHSVEDIKVRLVHHLLSQNQDYDFYIFNFKTEWCPFNHEHNKAQCIYAHNFQDFRRKPNLFKYDTELCEDWQSGTFITCYAEGCKRLENCPYSHGWKEQQFHPLLYKTLPCEEVKCFKGLECPYYHSSKDRRVLDQKYINDPVKIHTPKQREFKCQQQPTMAELYFANNLNHTKELEIAKENKEKAKQRSVKKLDIDFDLKQYNLELQDESSKESSSRSGTSSNESVKEVLNKTQQQHVKESKVSEQLKYSTPKQEQIPSQKSQNSNIETNLDAKPKNEQNFAGSDQISTASTQFPNNQVTRKLSSEFHQVSYPNVTRKYSSPIPYQMGMFSFQGQQYPTSNYPMQKRESQGFQGSSSYMGQFSNNHQFQQNQYQQQQQQQHQSNYQSPYVSPQNNFNPLFLNQHQPNQYPQQLISTQQRMPTQYNIQKPLSDYNNLGQSNSIIGKPYHKSKTGSWMQDMPKEQLTFTTPDEHQYVHKEGHVKRLNYDQFTPNRQPLSINDNNNQTMFSDNVGTNHTLSGDIEPYKHIWAYPQERITNSGQKYHSLNFPYQQENFYQEKLQTLQDSIQNLKFNEIEDEEDFEKEIQNKVLCQQDLDEISEQEYEENIEQQTPLHNPNPFQLNPNSTPYYQNKSNQQQFSSQGQQMNSDYEDQKKEAPMYCKDLK